MHMILKALLATLFVSAGVATARPNGGVSGVWMLNDTHTFYLQEDRDGALHGTVLVRDALEYEARIDMQRAAPGVYTGTGQQWYGPGGCVETYYATYRLVGANRLRVELTGSTGDCGIDPHFRMTYEVRRAPQRPRPLAGIWVLGATHRWSFDEDDFGGVTGTVSLPADPSYSAFVEVYEELPNVYVGEGRQTINGCTTTYFARYALLNMSRVRVTLLGSDGACGADPSIHMNYDIVRGL